MPRSEELPRVPLTMEEWIEKAKKAEAEGQTSFMEPTDCRDYLSSVVASVADAIHVVLFCDPTVKNHFASTFVYEQQPQFGFTVCFKRNDGHYPGDKPLLEAFQKVQIEELEDRLATLQEEHAKLIVKFEELKKS